MSNPVQDVQRLGQSIWYDNIRRGLLDSGELKRLIEMGVTGLTSNPTIFEKAIAGSTDYDEALTELARSNKSVDESYEALVIEDIRNTADLLRPIYDRTGGVDGYASLEVSPKLAHDTAGTTAEARRLFGALDKPNVMIKVPATAEGIPAVRQLISEGININVTLIFSLEAYRQVMEAYITGLEEYVAGGGDPSRIASVASFFVSRVDTAVDALLEERVRQGAPDVKALMGKAAIANAKLAYREFQQVFGEERFSGLKDKQARPQRPLWASTSTKNPAYSDLMYVEALIGPDTVDTLPPATLTALLEYGKPGLTLATGTEQAEEHLAGAGRGWHQHDPGYRHAPGRWGEIVRRLLRYAAGQHQREDGQTHRPDAHASNLLSRRPPAGRRGRPARPAGQGGYQAHLVQGPHRMEARPH